MKNILVSGANGFIGKNLIEYIKSNFRNAYKIIALSSARINGIETVLHKNYSFTKEDFSGLHIDIVIHLGAFTPKSNNEANDIIKSNSNITNTKYLLDNLPNIPDRFIFASTIDVYGKADGTISENTATQPLTMYGWSKLYCERMIENWVNGKSVILQILRIGHIYGVGEEAYKKLIPVTIKRIKYDKNPQIFGKGEEKRSFLHVKDVCNLIINSINLEKYEEVINLCSSHSHTIKEIVKLLLKISNKELKIEYIESQSIPFDLIFNTIKMNRLLGDETINLEKGLIGEYVGKKLL